MVSKQKIQKYEHIVSNIKKSKTIGIVDFHKLPGAQTQSIRAGLRDVAKIELCGKKIIIRALNDLKKEKKNIEKLLPKQEDVEQTKIPALIYSDINPFELSKKIEKQKSSIWAKQGDIAEEDIIVPKGDTNLPPGPAISDLKKLKIKSAIKGPKIVILEDKILVEAKKTIDNKTAEMLMKLLIKPMKITLNLKKCYENNIIYDKSTFTINLDDYKNKINDIYNKAFNLGVNINYPASEIVEFKITEASQQANNLAIEANIINADSIKSILLKANSKAIFLSSLLPKQEAPSVQEETKTKEKDEAVNEKKQE